MVRLILPIALVVVLVVAGLGGLGWFSTPLVSRADAAGAAAAVQPQAAILQQALADAKKSGTAVPITLSFTERELTLAAAAYFPQTVSGATLTDPQVRLRSSQLVLQCIATVFGFHTTAVVVATPLASAGRVTVRIDSATIAGVAVPDSVRADLASQLDQVIASGLPPGFVVSAVTVANATLTIQGTAIP
jgi:hypothetical protein